VSAVLQLNKSGVWFVFATKENLCYFISMTESAPAWTRIATQANTRMTTSKQFVAWLFAWLDVTWFKTFF
jgi:hypothetical protein